MVRLIVIDCFCGGGGMTEGIHRAKVNGENCAVVIIGINHDEKAIKSHAANHPDTHHFIEDFTKLNPIRLWGILKEAKERYPNALVAFHMSAECTHHSRANGGRPRDADSRSLPEYAYSYIDILRPDIITVENVTEFLSWGPLDEDGKPVAELKGIFYERWVNTIKQKGYEYEYRILNAADYGAYTSRTRYYGIFAREKLNIAFPEPTHSKKRAIGLKPWKAVKDVLDLTTEGNSIFKRKKPLVEATLKRIYAGLVKFVAGGKANYLNRYNAFFHPYVVNPRWTPFTKTQEFITTYYGSGAGLHSTNGPAPTITTKDRCALIKTNFIDQQYGRSKPISTERPLNTLTANPKYNLVFLDKQYGTGVAQSGDIPAPTITTVPKVKLISCWLMDTNFNNVGRSITRPMGTITANRKHFYLLNPQFRNAKNPISFSPNDSCMTMKIKIFMLLYGISDIKMRMLNIPELKRIMGFRDDYKLFGTKADIKKFIGNAVECTQAKVIYEAIARTVEPYKEITSHVKNKNNT